MKDRSTIFDSNRVQIAVIDDDIFIREAWALLGHEFDALTFESPEAFLNEIGRNPDLGSSFDAIIVDYNFGARSRMSGADLAAVLKTVTASPLILSTDSLPSEISGAELFDLQLEKNILTWRQLGNLIPGARMRRI
jgi:hypothetical protein